MFEEIGTVKFFVTFKRKTGELTTSRFQGTGTQKSSQKILDMIVSNPHITIREMADVLNITDRAIKKNIENLKKNGVLKRVGPDKGGSWEVVGNPA